MEEDTYYYNSFGHKHSVKYKYANKDQRAKATIRMYKWRAKNPEHVIWMRVRDRARRRNIPFNLEVTDIIIPEYCPVLNIKLTPIDADRKHGLCMSSPSIDKINPELGYIKGNIIIVSVKANLIKSNATPEEILQVGQFYMKLKESQVGLEHIGLSGCDTVLKLVA